MKKTLSPSMYPILFFRLLGQVLPSVHKELAHWKKLAKKIPDLELRQQALGSLHLKAFHSFGAGVYSLAHQSCDKDFLSFAVALQTISDYLDNLCDRLTATSLTDQEREAAFHRLHAAVTDALNPHTSLHSYYALYPLSRDGEYLSSLVLHCRQYLSSLPSYSLIQHELMGMAGLYSELQTFKHLSPALRDEKMRHWFSGHLDHYPTISGWEFSAASGSTLGMFVLTAAARNPSLRPQEVTTLSSIYFPWLQGFHILLDYFIDQEEDRIHNDLNFFSYYADEKEALQSLQTFQALTLQALPNSPLEFINTLAFHGLPALYLSDKKTASPVMSHLCRRFIESSPSITKNFYYFCRMLRYFHIL